MFVSGEGAGKNTLIKVGSSKVTMGKPYDFPSYGWDNEYGEWTTKYEYQRVKIFTFVARFNLARVLYLAQNYLFTSRTTNSQNVGHL